MKATLVFLALAVTAGALAQSMNQFDFVVSDVRVLQDRAVQNDIGVSANQRARMNAFAERHRARLADLEKSFGSQKPTESARKQAELQVLGYMSDLKKSVLGVLSPKQLQRLREITLQGYGWSALADERVGTRIGLTAKQQKQVQKVIADGQEAAKGIQAKSVEPIIAHYRSIKPKDEAEAAKLNTEMQAKIQAAGKQDRPALLKIQAQVLAKIKQTLSQKQQTSYIKLQGTRFRGNS